MTNESKFPWWGWLVVLFLVPVVYVLSVFLVGPVLRWLNLGIPGWLRTFYAPLIWAVEEWEWLSESIDWIGGLIGQP